MYDVDELREGILDLFEEGTARSRFVAAFGELVTTRLTRIRTLSDDALLADARAARPSPRLHPPLREKREKRERLRCRPSRAPRARSRGGTGEDTQLKRIHTLRARGYCVCLVCGARSTTHRCPG
jgi:hypothetical protein